MKFQLMLIRIAPRRFHNFLMDRLFLKIENLIKIGEEEKARKKLMTFMSAEETNKIFEIMKDKIVIGDIKDFTRITRMEMIDNF